MSKDPVMLVPDWALDRGRLVGPGEHPLGDLIYDLFEQMDPGQRDALRMWAWEGMTYQEIADELGLAGRQSGQDRVRAGLRSLQALLEEAGINGTTFLAGTQDQSQARDDGDADLQLLGKHEAAVSESQPPQVPPLRRPRDTRPPRMGRQL